MINNWNGWISSDYYRRVTAPSISADIQPHLDGVIVVDGYGVRIGVRRGHLIISDGAGRNRRDRRVPRIGHNLRRLVVVGHTGTISLEAVRWLDRSGIHFTQLDTDGQVLMTSANPRLDDARLRRAQHLAYGTDVAVEISRYLIDAKLAGQANVARQHLHPNTVNIIENHRDRLLDADTTAAVLKIEAKAAKEYFASWNDHVSITWATSHRDQVPEHWNEFRARRSLITITGTSKATNPINATLNYLYALAEIECRNACLTLGLDLGLGYLHADTPQRDSLALDLIEAIRPDVDRFTLDLLRHHIFRADDFTEREDGHCRINAPLSHKLAATLLDWQLAIAPHAERVGALIFGASPRRLTVPSLARGADRPTVRGTAAQRVRRQVGTPCRDCGTTLAPTATLYCPDCLPARRSTQRRKAIAASASQLVDSSSREARGRQVSQGRLTAKIAAARDFGYALTDWEEVESEVRQLSLLEIMSATGLAITQSSKIKSGRSMPHPRHWSALIGATRGCCAIPPTEQERRGHN